MILKLHRPEGELGLYVALMVYHQDYAPPHSVERYLPDGSIDLVIDLTEEPKYIFDDETLAPRQTCRRAWVSGMRTGFISISVGAGSAMLVVSFRAHGARPILHVPQHEIADTVLDADTVLGTGINLLREHLLSLATPEARFKAVEEWLLSRLRAPRNGIELARFATEAIARAPHLATIDDIAFRTGVSGKHLISVFREYVGITPKQFQRIKRFQEIVTAVERAEIVDWPQLALECGFFDQAHLIRDFQHFCGMTPTEYVAGKGDILNYVPVG